MNTIQPMNTIQIIQLFIDKGLLSEDDTFTLARGEEVARLSIQGPHPVLMQGLQAEEKRALGERLERVYERNSPILSVSTNGNILRMSIEEFNNWNGDTRDIYFFDPRKGILREATSFSLQSIQDTVDRLLAPGGCPWDRAQDHQSLRTYFLQEVYEVLDAIDKNDMVNLQEELGDVLLQIVFHAALAQKEGYFSMQDVVDGITKKMVRRHPFVFGEITEEETRTLLGDWEKRKRLEKNRKYLLSGVSKDLPSLLLACIIQRKVSSNGRENIFFTEDIQEEIRDSISRILSKGTTQEKESRIGAFLFAVDRVISEAGIEPELALHQISVQRMNELHAFEKELERKGRNLMDLTPEEARTYWQEFSRKADQSIHRS